MMDDLRSFSRDDCRQAGIVARNEIRKFVRGKKLYLCIGIVALIWALMTFLPYAFGNGLHGTTGEVFGSYVGWVTLLCLLLGVLFAAGTIVSEFEERTALVLFTRPIKKSSIYLGKFLACYALEALMILLYYLASFVVAVAVGGGSTGGGFFPSLLLALAYLFAVTGIALLFSSFMKKASTAVILTFVFLLMLFPIIETVIVLNVPNGSVWWLLDNLSGTIQTCIPALQTAATGAVHAVRDFFVLLVWGLIPGIAGFVIFQRREL